MTPKEFFEAVADMRAKQKAYFKERTKDNLVASKVAESAVDMEIKRVREVLAQEGGQQ